MNRRMGPLGIIFLVLVWASFLIMLGNGVYKGIINLNEQNNSMFKNTDDILHGHN